MSLTIKNYKKLESWAHHYKEFMIGEIIETETEYSFRVGYNKTPYIIKIFRNGTTAKQYEMELRDGMNTTQYGRAWIKKDFLETQSDTVQSFETMIVKYKPKAKQTTGNTNFNNPF